MRPSFVLLALAMSACAPRYYCGPGTHADGDWCLADAPTDSGTPDSGGADTGDSGGGDTGDTGLPDDTAETGDTGPAPALLVINEYMSSNDSKAADEYGEFDDFVELYNAGGQTADLSTVSLTDDSENLGSFRFAAGTTLAPGAWIVVWCDGTPDQGALHALFTLQSAADRVFLVADPDGAATILDSVEFTGMATEVSSARIPDGGADWVITANVTPGAANQP